MITAKERKAAIRALRFNWGRAWRLFCFCFASFIIGLTILYWHLDFSYLQHIDSVKASLLQEMAELKDHQHMQPVADLYEGLVAYDGVVDFDQAKIIVLATQELPEKGKLHAVIGQKREVARNVYEIRFVAKNDSNAAQH